MTETGCGMIWIGSAASGEAGFAAAAFGVTVDLDCAGDFAGVDCFAFASAFAINAADANRINVRNRADAMRAEFIREVLL